MDDNTQKIKISDEVKEILEGRFELRDLDDSRLDHSTLRQEISEGELSEHNFEYLPVIFSDLIENEHVEKFKATLKNEFKKITGEEYEDWKKEQDELAKEMTDETTNEMKLR